MRSALEGENWTPESHVFVQIMKIWEVILTVGSGLPDYSPFFYRDNFVFLPLLYSKYWPLWKCWWQTNIFYIFHYYCFFSSLQVRELVIRLILSSFRFSVSFSAIFSSSSAAILFILKSSRCSVLFFWSASARASPALCRKKLEVVIKYHLKRCLQINVEILM